MGQWGPNNPNRCQAVERRVVYNRSKHPSHVSAVQCGLPRNHEGEHVSRNKAFGS